MSKTTEIREICGDYAFDVEYHADNVFTMFFNSRRNAETVKRCIEIDDSVPNVATAVDFVEVVRCKNCRHYHAEKGGWCERHDFEFDVGDYCSHGERSEAQNG